MTDTKRDRIFLGCLTSVLALAGTVLTIANHYETSLVIAVSLGASFSACELAFLWGHKKVAAVNRLWKRITVNVSLVAVVLAMSYAVSTELPLVFGKFQQRQNVEATKQVLNTALVNATQKERSTLSKAAMQQVLVTTKVETHPYVLCYAIAGLVSILLLAVTGRQQTRRRGLGNQMTDNPALQQHVRQIGFSPDEVKAYRDPRGYALWRNGRYLGFVKDGFDSQSESK